MSAESRRRPLLTLLLLSPAIGELLSGSSPPEEFFIPWVFATLVALYGAGAVLAREAWVRWGRSPARLLLLGAAYGILEEGVMTRSFFCPTWPDLDILGTYGRWAGVNWVWTVELTVFHAVFSVAVPVGIVELLYPESGGRPWLGRRGLALAGASLAGVTALGLVGFRCGVPVPAGLVIAALLAASALVALAKGVDREYIPAPRPSARPLASVTIGAAWATFTVLGPFALAHTPVHPLLTCVVELAAALTYFRWALARCWPGLGAFDAAAGPLLGLWFVAVLQGFNVPTMLLVAVAFPPLLIAARRRVSALWRMRAAPR